MVDEGKKDQADRKRDNFDICLESLILKTDLILHCEASEKCIFAKVANVKIVVRFVHGFVLDIVVRFVLDKASWICIAVRFVHRFVL